MPDLLVGYKNINILIEVKDGNAPKTQQKLTPDQVVWHATWRGQVCVVNSIDAALAVIEALK